MRVSSLNKVTVEIVSPTPFSSSASASHTHIYLLQSRFEVAECWRRLLLASVVGIADANSAAAPTIGLLISLFYVFVFMELRPFKEGDDNKLSILLAFSLVLFFLAALMVKVDATGDSAGDQRTFDALLLLVLGSGPVFVLAEYAFHGFTVASILRKMGCSPHKEDPRVPDNPSVKTNAAAESQSVELANEAGKRMHTSGGREAHWKPSAKKAGATMTSSI
jgi:hypothetical protein